MNDQEKKPIKPNPLCYPCRYSLIRGAKFKESDPWMALEIGTLLTLINITLKKKKFHIAYAGDVENIERIKCLGCYLPDDLKEIIKIAKETRSIESVKSFGENYSEET